MSDYSNFLRHFNSKKRNQNSEDLLFKEGATAVPFTEEEIPEEEKITPESVHLEIKNIAEKKPDNAATSVPQTEETKKKTPTEIKPEKPLSHFINGTDAIFVAVNESEDDDAVALRKYADRMKQSAAPQKKHTGYTGKLNTYAANHAPKTDAPKFKPLTDEERTDTPVVSSKKDTPEKSAVHQTRIKPEVVVLSKKADIPEEKEDKPKEYHDYFDISENVENTATEVPEATEQPEADDEDIKIVTSASDFHPAESAVQETAPEETVSEHTDSVTEQPEPSVPEGRTKRISTAKSTLLRKLAKTGSDISNAFGNLADDEESSDDIGDTSDEENDEELELELRKNREKRINDFNFWHKTDKGSGQSADTKFTLVKEKKSLPEALEAFTSKFEKFDSNFLNVKCDSFRDFNHHRPIFKALMELRRNTLIKAAVVSGLGLIMLIINIVTAASASLNNGFFTVFGGNSTAYITINLIFMFLTALIMADDLTSGLFSLLQARPKTDTALLFMIVTSFIQIIASFATQLNIENDFHLLTGGIILLCAPLLISKSFYYDNIRHCFKTVVTKNEKSYLRKVNDKALTASLVSDNNAGDKNVVYAGKTKFIADFIERSRTTARGGEISSRFTLIAIGVSVIIGIIGIIAKHSFLFGVSAMGISAALSFPIGCVFFTGFMLSNENRALSLKSSFINSFDDAHDFVSIDNLVIKAEDAFKAKITDVETYGGVTEKQAAFAAAAIANAADGVLKNPLLKLAGTDAANFPETEDLTYEEKMGLSAWVSGCKTLLGSRTFLENHNVEIPESDSSEDEKYVYLALSGHAVARFTVKYACRNEAVRKLRLLADNGTNILLVSSDPNLTDIYAEHLLALPADSVKTVNRKAAQRITSEQETVTDAETAGIVFTDSFESLCRCAFAALRLNSTGKLSKIICQATSGTGLALALLFAISGSAALTSCWLPVLIQILWMLLCFFLPPVLSPAKTEGSKKSTVRPVSVSKPYTPDNYTRPEKEEAEEETEYVNDPEEDEEEVYDEDEEEYSEDEEYDDKTEEEEEDDTVFVELPEMEDFSGFSLTGNRETPSAQTPRQPSRNKNTRGGKKASNTTKRSYYDRETPRMRESYSYDDAPQFADEHTFRTSSADAVKRRVPASKPSEKRSIMSFAEEKLPAPPKFDLDGKNDLSFLDAKFVPPETDDIPATGTLFDDEVFSRFETDDIFAGLKDKNTKTFKF